MAKGYVLAFSNAANKGVDALRRAIRLSPFDPLSWRFTGGLAIAYMMAGQYEETIHWANRCLQEMRAIPQGFGSRLLFAPISAALRRPAAGSSGYSN
jgi:hypothetical protein